jgi:hypothetical protein
MRFIVSYTITGQVQVDAESDEDATALVKKRVTKDMFAGGHAHVYAQSLIGIPTYGASDDG